ncbi:hypothetical protein ACFE04_029923 [Oxalis oulophora]
MCCESESLEAQSRKVDSPANSDMNHLTVETEDSFASLLELAANNDVEAFRRSIEHDPSGVDEAGSWYERKKGSKQMVNEQRTPLMVAATYGSIDIIRLILSLSDADVSSVYGLDKSTALHCAASGGATNSVDVVKLLLAAGADPNIADVSGNRPIDVIVVPPKLGDNRNSLEELLATDSPGPEHNLRVSVGNSNSPPPENGSPLSASGSPMKFKCNDAPVSEKKEYPIDPSLPDIKNSIYSTDEFRMYSFKVRPCSRAYSHDWTECPFVHPGENARRRDPRKFHYSCVPCPEFRKGSCRRQDMCEYAHGVFECWLHPAQYRTRLCKDGTSCNRRVCFFAHTPEELRPLYVSTGSAVLSPRSMDFMSLLPGSPSSVNVMSPSQFTPPMSPSGNGNGPWPQPNVPALHLPGSNFQSSRLRSSINARDINAEELNMMAEYDMQKQQLVNEFSNSINRFGSSGRMSPRNVEPISPMNSRMSLLAQRDKQQFRSLSSRELGSSSAAVIGSPGNSNPNSWSKWGASNGKPDWAVSTDELGKLRRSNSFELGNGDEPDLSWVQSLVKESPTDKKENANDSSTANPQKQAADHSMLEVWLEQVQLDQLVVQQN